jgi:hypothetical protein
VGKSNWLAFEKDATYFLGEHALSRNSTKVKVQKFLVNV